MTYYLTVNGKTEEFENEIAYVLKIQKLRSLNFNIEYEIAEGKLVHECCNATLS